VILVVVCALFYASFRGWQALRDCVSKSEILTIKNIVISGTRNISRGEILALLPFDTGDNILVQNLGKAEKEVLDLKPELKKISIHRGFKKISVYVRERVPVGFVTIQGNRLGIDYDNVPFPLRGEYLKADLPEISAQNDSDRQEILGFVKIFSERAKEYFPKSSSFYLESIENAALKLKDGTKIVWGKIEKDKFDGKLRRLNEIVSDASKRFPGIEYINLDYFDSGRVLVKPKMLQK
jgi:cell division septal protein FtsQ